MTNREILLESCQKQKEARKRRTETLLATQLNSGNEVRHQIQCKWYHYTSWMDGPLQQPCSCCGIRLAVLRAALLLGWPLPATGAPATPWALWGFGPQSWCQWHQQDCGEVNCAATWDDRTRHSIGSTETGRHQHTIHPVLPNYWVPLFQSAHL